MKGFCVTLKRMAARHKSCSFFTIVKIEIVSGNTKQPDFAKQNGLVPIIVQGENGEVLMLAYTNQEAHNLTLETGFAHFWSRSRKNLWKKGATSGNLLQVKEVWLDCDLDTLLYRVRSPGNVCHLGTPSCFSKIGIESR